MTKRMNEDATTESTNPLDFEIEVENILKGKEDLSTSAGRRASSTPLPVFTKAASSDNNSFHTGLTRFRTFKLTEDTNQDAENGFLSYSHMVQKANRAHYSVIPDGKPVEGEKAKFFKRLPLFSTPTGALRCKRNKGKASKATGLDMGVLLYFKQLKAHALFYLFITLLSVPSFVLFYFGGDQEQQIDNKTFFSLFTLGNLGQQGS